MLRPLRWIAWLVLAGLLHDPLQAQDYQPLLDEETRDLLHEELSGELAKEHVFAITRWSRVQGSRQFRDSANYVLETLRGYGFDEQQAWIESFPSDGKIHYQTWQSPSGFDMSHAELRMLEPYEERIVGYPEIPMSLMTYSNPGEATGELVWVGTGTSDDDYEGRDVRGKIVLATGYGGSVHRLAVVKYGALAVVCFLDDERAREYPDMLQYTGIWPRSKELPHVTFGFNLTNRQGRKLLALLEAGERVVVRGTAEGIGLEPYFMDVPVAFIRGSELSEETLVVSAHLDHPKESANDNASGSAAMLDMARGLSRLIASGRLPRPRRSIQFIWVPEFYGTMAYVDAHPEVVGPELGGSHLANLNLDMVGEHQELLHSRATYTRTPSSIPSVLNDVVENMVQMVARMEIRTPRGSLSSFNYRVTPYSGGSDHNMFIDRKIPGMMFGHSPDYTHHTSEDTPDKVDPVELEREEIIAAATLVYLGSLTDDQAAELAYLAGANATRRLGLAARRAQALVREAGTTEVGRAWTEAANLLIHEHGWARGAVTSIRYFSDGAADEIDTALGQLDAQLEVLNRGLARQVAARGFEGEAPPPPSFEVDARIARRTTRGPIDGTYIAEQLEGQPELEWYLSPDQPIRGARQFELHNFLNGQRSVGEVRDALSAEFGPIDPQAVSRYVELLIQAGLAEWR